MRSTIRTALLALAAIACVANVVAQPATTESSGGGPAAAAGPSAGGSGIAGTYVIPALPRPDETNAERSRSQPGNNAPFWRGVRESGSRPGISNLPGAEQGVLIQEMTQYPGSRMASAGEAWRQVRNWWIIPYGGALILIVTLALALFYFARGPLGGHEADTGRVIQRFTYLERAAHWVNAIAFVVLAISGVVIAFGKFFLLPVMGSTLFGWLSYALKNVHNFAGPLFAVSLAIVFLTFLRSNMPGRGDLAWLLKGGGMFGGGEPASHRFNAGEKLVFWVGVFLLGAFVVSSGLVLDKLIPGMNYLRGDMQVAHMVHAISAALMIAVFLVHTYMGTVGMKGSYQAMKTGYVDEGWAREHHRYWYEDVKNGTIPVERDAAVRTVPATGRTT